LAFGLVDGLLLLRFRRLDDLLLVALGLVDRGVALPFRLQDRGAFFAFGAHLLFHRRQHVLRRVDVLDLVAEHFHAPRFRGFVDFADDHQIDVCALLERAIELDLADLAAQVGLRQLRDREGVVRDTVRRPCWIEDFEIEHSVHGDLNVVARDADLLGNVHGHFLERVLVTDRVEERPEDVEARLERGGILAQPLHHPGVLLRNDARDPADHDERKDDDDEGYKESSHDTPKTLLLFTTRGREWSGR
jgi:hypothetical protein